MLRDNLLTSLGEARAWSWGAFGLFTWGFLEGGHPGGKVWKTGVAKFSWETEEDVVVMTTANTPWTWELPWASCYHHGWASLLPCCGGVGGTCSLVRPGRREGVCLGSQNQPELCLFHKTPCKWRRNVYFLHLSVQRTKPQLEFGQNLGEQGSLWSDRSITVVSSCERKQSKN